ncbi:hypothetical protein C8F04DRAFT_956985 [Mycena alexandri]|uniref:Uncharacterized protein n=1 Tax=Mycena alexandri TaxID=1745969 RepID=A0AAD6SUS5_9AGAR|nr:hypothetical protein C8F04DRAFT_956985 [Mycena alexandri]
MTVDCDRGLASLIQGGTWDSTGLPECFKPTHERRLARGRRVVDMINVGTGVE